MTFDPCQVCVYYHEDECACMPANAEARFVLCAPSVILQAEEVARRAWQESAEQDDQDDQDVGTSMVIACWAVLGLIVAGAMAAGVLLRWVLEWR